MLMDTQNTYTIDQQCKCINAYASVYTYLALISPFLEAAMGSECEVMYDYTISFAVNSEELVRVEETGLHILLIWLHLRIYWESVQVEYSVVHLIQIRLI